MEFAEIRGPWKEMNNLGLLAGLICVAWTDCILNLFDKIAPERQPVFTCWNVSLSIYSLLEKILRKNPSRSCNAPPPHCWLLETGSSGHQNAFSTTVAFTKLLLSFDASSFALFPDGLLWHVWLFHTVSALSGGSIPSLAWYLALPCWCSPLLATTSERLQQGSQKHSNPTGGTRSIRSSGGTYRVCAAGAFCDISDARLYCKQFTTVMYWNL